MPRMSKVELFAATDGPRLMDPGETDDELLPLLLRICEDFFVSTSPATRRELDALLAARGITGGPGWLIDMLALTRLRLESPTEHDGSRQSLDRR